MLKNIRPERLRDGIMSACPVDRAFAAQLADELIRDTDERLEVNVQQWLRREPLTDEWVGNYCAGLVMKIHGCGFLEALQLLNLYAKDPADGERMIWRTIQ